MSASGGRRGRIVGREAEDAFTEPLAPSALPDFSGSAVLREGLQVASALRISHFPDPPPASLEPVCKPRLDTEGSQSGRQREGLATGQTTLPTS
jgi:hypothetical protein